MERLPGTHRPREDTLNLTVRTHAPQGNPLVSAYLGGDPSAVRFFGSHFSGPDAYRARLEELTERFGRAEREAGIRALSGPAERSGALLRRFVDEGGAFVSTGQQPGLFGGPLYTLYKLLTTAALARQLESALGRPVLPLFWIASEDHDWDEVASVRLPDRENRLRTITLPRRFPGSDPSPGDPRAVHPREPPIHRTVPGEEVAGALEDFLQALPDTDFSGPAARLLRESYRPGRSLNESFRALLHSLPAMPDFFTVDASDPELKRLSEPTLFQELDGASGSEERLRARAGEIEEAGYPVQAPVLPGGVNLFLEGPEGRERIYRTEGGDSFRLRHSGVRLTRAEIRDRWAADPRTLSPNVFLRPVVEGSVFPVIASVAGPGEIGYWAQLEPLFHRHGLEPPVVHPRLSATLVEAKVEKVLRKFELELADLSEPHHEVAGRVVRDEFPEAVRDALSRIRRAVGEGSGQLSDSLRELDPTLRRTVDTARSRAFQAFEEVERKVVQSLKRQNEITLEQIAKAQLHLFPDGRPQERVISPFYYLFRYGDELIGRLAVEAARAVEGSGGEAPVGSGK